MKEYWFDTDYFSCVLWINNYDDFIKKELYEIVDEYFETDEEYIEQCEICGDCDIVFQYDDEHSKICVDCIKCREYEMETNGMDRDKYIKLIKCLVKNGYVEHHCLKACKIYNCANNPYIVDIINAHAIEIENT
jgi:hypothetical protein